MRIRDRSHCVVIGGRGPERGVGPRDNGAAIQVAEISADFHEVAARLPPPAVVDVDINLPNPPLPVGGADPSDATSNRSDVSPSSVASHK